MGGTERSREGGEYIMRAPAVCDASRFNDHPTRLTEPTDITYILIESVPNVLARTPNRDARV